MTDGKNKPREFWINVKHEKIAHNEDEAARKYKKLFDHGVGDPTGFLMVIEKSYADRLEAEIQALKHEGRQGELEQANVGLADEVRKLESRIEKLRDGLKDIEDNERYGMPRKCWQDMAKQALAEDDKAKGGE